MLQVLQWKRCLAKNGAQVKQQNVAYRQHLKFRGVQNLYPFDPMINHIAIVYVSVLYQILKTLPMKLTGIRLLPTFCTVRLCYNYYE
jgi:hypothetical protein